MVVSPSDSFSQKHKYRRAPRHGQFLLRTGKSMSKLPSPAGRRESSSTGVAPHVFSLGQDVALHGPFDLFLRGARLEIQLGIEGVEFEEVAMRLPRRRTRPPISNFFKVIPA